VEAAVIVAAVVAIVVIVVLVLGLTGVVVVVLLPVVAVTRGLGRCRDIHHYQGSLGCQGSPAYSTSAESAGGVKTGTVRRFITDYLVP
jgi:hypothetical protein